MKKLLYIASMFAAALMVGCNYNDQFGMDLEENARPTDVKSLEYTLTADDYKTISTNKTNVALATENGESNELKALASNLYFTNKVTAAEYAPAFIAAKWYTADPGSQVLLTYDYEADRPRVFDAVESAGSYSVGKADYQSVWGDEENFVMYFSPAYSAEKNLPAILATALPAAEAGDFVVVDYNFSATEPVFGGSADEVKLPTFINEKFDGYANYVEDFTGWQNVKVAGDVVWYAKTYNDNSYIECTAYNKSGEVVDAWMISQQIDLSLCENPRLAFDVCLGYPKGDAKLHVLYSEDYDGEDVEGATWVDLTNNYAFHKKSGYGKSSPAGIGTLTFAEGSPKKVYIAFRYTGNTTDATTTFQVDNIQLGDVVDVVATEVYSFNFPGKTLGDWTAVDVKGNKEWYASEYAGTPYASMTAYNGDGEQEDWLISPEIEIPETTDGGANTVAQLSFVVKYRFHNGDCLTAYVSEDYAGDVATATWTEISSEFALALSDANNDNYATAGYAALNSYAGKKIRVAFKYTGSADGVTTTLQLTDVKVQTLAHAAAAPAVYKVQMAATEKLQALYEFNGSAWTESSVILLSAADYKTMGSTYGNLSGDYNAYLTKFLALEYPFAVADDVKTIAFKYYNGSATALKAAQYAFDGADWVSTATASKTDQFKYTPVGWTYDPSIELTLEGNKNAVAQPYYQAIVDYVAEQFGAGYYQTGYTNAERYYGASAYYTNFDFRLDKWRGDCPIGGEAYGAMSDEELVALQYERLKEAFVPMLKKFWPTIAPVEGIEVTARVNFIVYDGVNHNYTILYDVTGVGEFAYREGSLKAVE